ncbi:MAG: ABC transporter permease subunit [Methanobacteriota archaeon]
MKAQVLISVAKKEIMDNIRNKWVIILSVIFALLTIVASYFGSLFSSGWQDLGLTIASMSSLVQFLISIIALMLGYAAVIGEIERGSMSSLVSLPATRLEILAGKFLGLGVVLSLTIGVGFGVAGVVIAVLVPNVNYGEYLGFIGLTVLFGLVFLSLALFFSTLFKKRSSAMGGAVLMWFFFNMILPMVFTGLLIAAVGLENLFSGDVSSAPAWYYGVQLLSPVAMYGAVVGMMAGPVASVTQQAVPMRYPSFYSPIVLVGVMVLWIVVFFLLAYVKFNKTDI